MAADGQADAAVLGQAALGDVQVGHDLDARGDGEGQVARRRHHLVEHAVGTDADLELVLERLEVQVAGVVLDGQQQDHVQQLADRGAVGQGLDAGQVDADRLLHRLRPPRPTRSSSSMSVISDFDTLAAGCVVALQCLEDLLLGGHHGPDVEAEEAAQLVDDRQLLRIAHGDRQRVVA